MANMVLLKRRIKTARNVSKTTRAMQMIAVSKLKRAQEAVVASRPYVEKLISLCVDVSKKASSTSHPYLTKPQLQKPSELLLILAPDKGLCGGLVSNLIKTYLDFSPQAHVQIVTIGKKIETAVARSANEIIASFPFGTSLPTFELVEVVNHIVNEYYLNQKISSVKVLYHKFTSLFVQTPTIDTILPITLKESFNNSLIPSYQLFEPSLENLLSPLLSRYLEMAMYQYLLESFASEQASRMIAMQNATDNARDIILELTLEYNKARQEKITNEILDISGGTAAYYA